MADDQSCGGPIADRLGFARAIAVHVFDDCLRFAERQRPPLLQIGDQAPIAQGIASERRRCDPVMSNEGLNHRQEVGVGGDFQSHIRHDNRIYPTMQASPSETSYIFSKRSMWDLSDMDMEDLRGRALYDALMEIKPPHMSEGDWAAKAGVNRGFFSDLKSKDIRPRIDTVRKLKRYAELVKPQDVVTPDLPVTRSAYASDDMVEITQVDLSFSMGNGTTIDDYVEETPVRFDLGYIRGFTRSEISRLRIAKGVGDSMAPTLLTSDLVWIDTTQNRLNQADRIWACSILGSAAIKRLRRVAQGQIEVISDNPGVENRVYDEDDIIILGRVIRFARDL